MLRLVRALLNKWLSDGLFIFLFSARKIVFADQLLKTDGFVSSSSLYGEKAMELPERTNEVTGVYANQCVELAKELQVPYINLWSYMQEFSGWQKKFLRLVGYVKLVTFCSSAAFLLQL